MKRPFLNDLWFNLRVQDTSRQGLTSGTEIPVVREADLHTTKIVLLNVPLDSRFRQALHVYDPDSRPTSTVRLRIFPMSASPAPLVETTLTLERPAQPTGNCTYRHEDCFPSFVEVQNLLGRFPELQGRERVFVEIESRTTALRFWSFITVTNNDTQHVTTITPQSRQVQPAPAPVFAAFDFMFSGGGQTVSFQDRSSRNAVSWSWNFGDGTGSSAPNPLKIYSAAGSYQVRLTITNGASSSSTTRTVTIGGRDRAAGRR